MGFNSGFKGLNNLAHVGRIFMKFYIWIFFENLYRKLNFHCNPTTNAGTSHEARYTYSCDDDITTVSPQNTGTSHAARYRYSCDDDITTVSPQNKKCFRQNLYRKSKYILGSAICMYE